MQQKDFDNDFNFANLNMARDALIKDSVRKYNDL